jgi:signal transduction histidine kinase
VLAWLDFGAGMSLLAVAVVGMRRFRVSALFALAAAVAWFVVPVAPGLVLLHRPLLLHSILALPRRRIVGLLPYLLLLSAWIQLLLPVGALPWAAGVTAGLAVAVAVRPSRVGLVEPRPALLILAATLVAPVVERAVWPQYDESGLPVATYLCGVIVCSGDMIRAMLASDLHEADSVIELSERTPDQAMRELSQAVEAGTRRGPALHSALALLVDNVRLQEDLADRIEEVRASRARLIDAASGERQRLERVLSDGALRYLDELQWSLGAMAPSGDPDPTLESCREESVRLREDLELLARGLHPRVLSDRGLAVALEQLCSRSPVPVEVRVPAGRFPERTETTVWYACAEALANVWKHAVATQVVVQVEASPGSLRAVVRDDGVGGAMLSSGGGLAGLVDRVTGVGGRLSLASSTAGTDVTIEVPY